MARSLPNRAHRRRAAPTGWTKDTTHDDKAIRLVTGTAGSGGAIAFSTTFGTGKTTDSHSLTNAEMEHQHLVSIPAGTNMANGRDRNNNFDTGPVKDNTATGHSHNLSNLDLQHVDRITATKD